MNYGIFPFNLFRVKIIVKESPDFGTKKIEDMNSPSLCCDSFIAPSSNKFLISSVKKNSLEENLIFIPLW